MSSSELAQLSTLVDGLHKRAPHVPRVGLVLGSGLGSFADDLKSITKIPYAELTGMPVSSVVGHAGNFVFGTWEGVPVVCMQGRVHLYEGHAAPTVVRGTRAMAKLGATCVLLTNAAGGLEPSWTPGDLMLITDHLNLTGTTPLLGANEDALGPRFADMTRAYDPEIMQMAREVGQAQHIALREGVYAGLLGPSYETPAEIRMVRTLGAQAVGMSTVLEVIALRHMGVRIGALSCITNLGAGISGNVLSHTEVEETARAKRQDLKRFLGHWIALAGENA